METALKIENLSYHYKTEWTRKHILALNNISLEVHAGETFGFLGHNGAGKTTAMKCILGLIQPTTGSISIFGNSQREISARRFLGYIPEQPYFYDHLRVQESMEMYACLAEIPASERPQRIQEALTQVNLVGRERSRMRSLSKGLMQRVAMAQAIVHQPRLLVLDEPFSGLDPIGRREFRELLVNLKNKGTTIFMSSHILSDVEFLCDRVSIIARGELKGVFSTRDIPSTASGVFELIIRTHDDAQLIDSLRSELHALAHAVSNEDRFLRLSFRDRAKAEKALRLSLDNHLGIESYEFVHSNLEDLFIQLVQSSQVQG